MSGDMYSVGGVQVPFRCPVCNSSTCTRYYDNPSGEIVCNQLKYIINNFQLLEYRVQSLEAENLALRVRALKPLDLSSLFETAKLYSYSDSSPLKKIINHPFLEDGIAYEMFKEILHKHFDNMLFTPALNELASKHFATFKEKLSEDDELLLINYLCKYKYDMPYNLWIFFSFEKPKLSEVVEDIIYDIIVERNINQNTKIPITTGNWSIYRILENYKEANLGKAVKILLAMTPQYSIKQELDKLLQTYPEAAKYIQLV